MKVFLSWSKPRSKALAEALKDWLPRVSHFLEPWMSPDIDKGAKWSSVVSQELEAAKVGIICLTPENLTEPWLLFEAGALSKTKDGYPCTLLFELEHADIDFPLAQFQHTVVKKKDDVLKFMRDLNRRVGDCGERPLADSILVESFESHWSKLEHAIQVVEGLPAEESRVTHRDSDTLLREILELSRGQDRRLAEIEASIQPIYVTKRRSVDMDSSEGSMPLRLFGLGGSGARVTTGINPTWMEDVATHKILGARPIEGEGWKPGRGGVQAESGKPAEIDLPDGEEKKD